MRRAPVTSSLSICCCQLPLTLKNCMGCHCFGPTMGKGRDWTGRARKWNPARLEKHILSHRKVPTSLEPGRSCVSF
eukprot:12217014-Prorocentrum_lima.AAC.1